MENQNLSMSDELSLTRQQLSMARQIGDQYKTEASNLRSAIASVRQYLVDNLDDLGDHATEIAEILGLTLTQTATVTVTVVHTFTITDLPASADAYSVIRDIENNVSFEADGYTSEGDIESQTYEITSTEADFE